MSRIYKNWQMCVFLLFFAIITIPVMIIHIPTFDESHAYMLAKFMNFSNFVEIVKMEGHPLLWFLVLMPFAKTNFYYPYPMLIINWLCWFGAIIIMWINAPFNKWLKVIITFSSISIIYFPVVARGYSMGYLLLFIIASLYQKQLQKPVLYAVLISLVIHVNLMCGILASAFACIFIFNQIKSGKISKASIAIILTSSLLFVLPYLTGYGDEASRNLGSPHNNELLKFFKSYYGFFLVAYLGNFIYILLNVDKRAKFFMLYTTTLYLVLFLFVYCGFKHHFILFFINLIFPIWISQNIEKWEKFDKIYILLGILLMFPLKSELNYWYAWNNFGLKDCVQIINNVAELQNNKLYIQKELYPIIPYLSKSIEPYELCHLRKIDLRTNLYCDVTQWSYEDLFHESDTIYIITIYPIPDIELIYGENGFYISKLKKEVIFKSISKER